MRDFFQSDLITILRMKKIHMGNFDDYEFFGGIHHCFRDTQCSCYASASASIYVPWSTMNAAAIMSSIDTLSKCFAIYPLSGRNMKHSILLDVTIKAQENYQNDFFELSSTKLKEIQSEISHYDKSIQCPSEVTDLLHMLNSKYGLENIKYVCLKVLGCHHKSFANSQYLEGFGMTVGGFFFPCFEKHDDCETAECISQNDKVEKQNVASKLFRDDDTSGTSGSESVEIVKVKKKKHRNECESSSESVKIVHETKKRSRNEFAAYFGSDGSSSDNSHSMYGKELFSVRESGNSHGCPVDAVRPVAEVLFNKSESDDSELVLPDDDEGSRDGYGRNGM